MNLFNYSLEDFKAMRVDSPFSYIVADNVIKQDLFDTFTSFVGVGNSSYTSQTGKINKGQSHFIGGGASKLPIFEAKLDAELHIDMLNTVAQFYDKSLIEFWCDVFDVKVKDSFWIGNKLSAYTHNYGWPIHPDGHSKVISLIFYYDPNKNPIDSKHNGTQLYTFNSSEEMTPDIDLLLHDDDPVHSNERVHSYIHEAFLTIGEGGGINPIHEPVKDIKLHKNVHFKPNRMVGFKNWYNSYHGIYPMKLGAGALRHAFQWNIWTSNRYK